MEKTNLWPCPLDEKNLCTDWIEESFEDNGIMRTPMDGHNGVYQFITFVEKCLCIVTWRFGTNQLTFTVSSEYFGELNDKDKCAAKAIEFAKAKIAEVESCDNGSDSKVVVRYNVVDNKRIDFFFYWE